MLMRTAITRLSFAAALAIAAATACGYSPNPESGTLQCGPSNSCPEGYSCRSGLCWKDGAGGSGGSGHGGSGGSSTADKFIGTWTFVAPSTRMIACTDNSSETKDWSNQQESFDVSAASGGALTTYYYCDWDLDIASGGTSTVIKPGSSCAGTDNSSTPPMTYTWHGMLFTLSTSNGRNGTLVADLPFDYSSTAGSGSCTMHFNGTLTKN